jgi:RNA polymerase sigma-70 factor, ECF subfamily
MSISRVSETFPPFPGQSLSEQVAAEPAMTDAARFEAFVREYQDMVFATAVRLLGSAAEAEDIAQTVFLRAFQRFAAVSTSATAAGWLKTVTTNLCLNHLSRYRARWQFFSELDRAGEDGSYEAALPSVADTAGTFEDADRHARLERALQALPDHQRVPLVLFHFEGMGYQEIASTLGVSLGKIKTDIHRGREGLRKDLGAVDESV